MTASFSRRPVTESGSKPIGVDEFFGDRTAQRRLQGRLAGGDLRDFEEFAQMRAEIGLGNEAELRQHVIETFAALRRGALRALQGEVVDGFFVEKKSAESLAESGTVRIRPGCARFGALKSRGQGSRLHADNPLPETGLYPKLVGKARLQRDA